ncbi:hypothetical protein J4Q44_G00121910 [Coregonus suidteri]|uniref:Uncharacterized protein n=1 Tax=Coregonus suidteri TaxID=861788 RepID=A0AAN8QYH0_9TELE
MSPHPVNESKLIREEMSASSELRRSTAGSKGGGSVVGRGGSTSSLDSVILSVVTEGAIVSDGLEAELSCTVGLLDETGDSCPGSASGTSVLRGAGLGVKVMSSLMISTLFVRDDMRRGLGGVSASSLASSRWFHRILLKRPFRPRRWRTVGWDSVRNLRSGPPRRLRRNFIRKLRDLAEVMEEMEGRPAEGMEGSPSSPMGSSMASSSL